MNYRYCMVCNKWIGGGGSKRRDAIYCSPACKMRAYRHRRGVTVKSIEPVKPFMERRK